MIVARIGHIAGNQIGNEQMPCTGAALLLRGLHPVVTGAVPAAFDRRGVKAGAAVHGSGPAAMADVVVRAHAALVPGGILADAGRRALGKDDPGGLLDQPFRCVLVGVDEDDRASCLEHFAAEAFTVSRFRRRRCDQALAAAERNVKLQQNEFENGLLTNLEVMQALDQRLQIKRNRDQAVYNAKLAYVEAQLQVSGLPKAGQP